MPFDILDLKPWVEGESLWPPDAASCGESIQSIREAEGFVNPRGLRTQTDRGSIPEERCVPPPNKALDWCPR